MLGDDILNGTINAPDFGHAMRLTRLVDAVFTSAERGNWETDSGWPTNGAIV